MSTAPYRAVMRLLAVAVLLLLGTPADGRARVSVHRHQHSHPAVSAASHAALLAAAPVPTGDDVAPTPLLAPEAIHLGRRVQLAPAPTRGYSSSCSYERTTCQAARPPPFQA